MNRKGISPVIATVLLIAITVALALIVFLWARGFVGEKVQKLGQPVESLCAEVNFNADVSNGKINVINRGNIPIYALDIKKKSAGSLVTSTPLEKTIKSGETASINLPLDVQAGDELLLTPEILGTKGEGGATTPYSCNDFGITVTV